MGCAAFKACDPCCRRLGCGCVDHDDAFERLASISTKRSCTDLPCCGVFVALLAFLVATVWQVAFTEGDPNRLIRGVNHAGLICGIDDGVKDLPYAFWPDPTKYRFKVCTDNCTTATEDDFVTNWIKIPNVEWVAGHPIIGYKSKLYIEKYCIPDPSEGLSIAGFDDFSQELERGMGDVDETIPIIGASIAIAFVMSFGFIWLMKCCVGVLVWSTVAVILVGGGALGYVLYDSKDQEDLSERESSIREYVAYGLFGFTAIFFFLVIFLRKRILIAIQVIKSAGRSIGDMPMMAIFPLGPLVLLIGFFLAWLYTTIYIFSAGELVITETPDHYREKSFSAEGGEYTVGLNYTVLNYDKTIQEAFAPHFFLLLWVVQIGVYFTFTVIAGAVANWYFTERDEDGNKIRGGGEFELSHRALTKSCCRTTRYHLGTIIYAALIIAIIQFVRWCVRYLERMMSANGKEPNKIQKILFRVVDCLLYCLECCLDKVSKNALIWVSVYGDAFCPSVCGSFKLIWTNMARVAVITFFSTIVTTLGKIMIPLLTTALCAAIFVFVEPYKSELSSPIYPLIIIFIISLAVALMFLTVYDTAIDTVFMCFLLDEKHNKTNGKMFADDGLRNIVQKYEQQSKELARSMQGNKVIVAEQVGGGDHHDEMDADDAIAI